MTSSEVYVFSFMARKRFGTAIVNADNVDEARRLLELRIPSVKIYAVQKVDNNVFGIQYISPKGF